MKIKIWIPSDQTNLLQVTYVLDLFTPETQTAQTDSPEIAAKRTSIRDRLNKIWFIQREDDYTDVKRICDRFLTSVR